MALTVSLALLLNLIPGSMLQWFHMRWGLVFSQTLFIAGPVLIAIRWFHLDRDALLPLYRPRAFLLPATAIATMALNHLLTVAGAWHEQVLPPPEPYRIFFDQLFVYRGVFDFALLLIVFTLVPAICEELLFRGFLLRGLTTLLGNPVKAIVLQAIIFALFHLDPWRFPEILVLGAFLGYIAQRTGSLIPAMLAHALNNTISIVLAAAGLPEAGAVPLHRWTLPLALALLSLALILVHRTTAGRLRARVL